MPQTKQKHPKKNHNAPISASTKATKAVELPWEFNKALLWEKAGEDEEDEDDFGGIKRSVTNPTFVVSNSTGHNWAFAAVAEIVDNAVDECAASGATRVSVDYHPSSKGLSFDDDGGGMEPTRLWKCLCHG